MKCGVDLGLTRYTSNGIKVPRSREVVAFVNMVGNLFLGWSGTMSIDAEATLSPIVPGLDD
jgi:hypothetical protein